VGALVFLAVQVLRARANNCIPGTGVEFFCRFQAVSEALQGLLGVAAAYCDVAFAEPATKNRPSMPKASSRSLPWTDDPAAARLLASDPMALLIGFLLDQQVPMEWAFGAPHTLKQRLGGRLDARTLATIEPEKLVEAFVTKPPLHRYPAAMARRTQALAQQIIDEYDGDTSRIWRDASDAVEAARRIARLPGFSANKAGVILGVLAKRLGVGVPGWEEFAPTWFNLADVDTPEALIHYRDIKRAGKAAGDWPPGSARPKRAAAAKRKRRRAPAPAAAGARKSGGH
jgi:uncharacterized HhH-GPD family protein